MRFFNLKSLLHPSNLNLPIFGLKDQNQSVEQFQKKQGCILSNGVLRLIGLNLLSKCRLQIVS